MMSRVKQVPSSSRLPRPLPALGRVVAVNLSTYTIRRFLIVLIFGILGTVGCGGSSGEDLAPVRGVVTLDGKSLTEGFVFVTPPEGKLAMGAIQSDGTFVLGTNTNSDGARVGTHPVSIQPPPASEGMPPSTTSKLLPKHYRSGSTSGLSVEVKPGTDNELKLELSTK